LTAEAFNLPLQLKSYAIPHIGVNNVDLEAFGEDGWIVHTGKLVRTRVSTEFLQAVKLARTQIPEKFKGLICVGVVQNEFREEVKALEMEDSVRIMDQMPHSDASWIMAAASALVVLEADMRVSPFLPSKFADYAVSGKYIIAVTPETSIIREYLNGSNVGIAVRHDRNEIAEGIINIFNRETNSDLPKSNFAELFSLQSVGREYSRMIMDAVGPQ